MPKLKLLKLKRLFPSGDSITSATGYSLRHIFAMREMMPAGRFWIEAEDAPAQRPKNVVTKLETTGVQIGVGHPWTILESDVPDLMKYLDELEKKVRR